MPLNSGDRLPTSPPTLRSPIWMGSVVVADEAVVGCARESVGAAVLVESALPQAATRKISPITIKGRVGSLNCDLTARFGSVSISIQ